MAAESEDWERSTADQEVEVADMLTQSVEGSNLQLVGMVEPVAGIVLLIETQAEESYIWFQPSLFFHPCKSTLRDFYMWHLGHI